MSEVLDILEKAIDYSLKLGVDYVDVRFEKRIYERITVDNRVLREYSASEDRGIGVRVIVDGYLGFAATTNTVWDSVREAIDKAVELAKSVRGSGRRVSLASVKPVRDVRVSECKIDPFTIDPSEKVSFLLDLNRVALDVKDVKSAITSFGAVKVKKYFMSSENSHIELDITMTGLRYISIAKWGDRLERVSDSQSKVAGYEFIKSVDWEKPVTEVSKLAVEVVKASTPPPGTYTVILDSDIVGLLLHEAFGHASEGDIVESGASVLAGKLGEKVASELVTIVDEGVLADGSGVYHPYDDEGVAKGKTVIVEKGILKTYLTSRTTASRLGLESTGNGRAQDYANIPLVRQTNLYMLPGDMKFEELLEDVDFGLYVTGKGATGGEVNTGAGTFTFSVGVSRIIRKGELCEYVRGVTLSGAILEVLKHVDGVSRELKVRTSVFGGCGKGGQSVYVGDGGPHIRVRRIVVGGR